MAAAGAGRVGRVGMDVAFVNVVKAGIESDAPRGVQRFRRGVRLIAQLEIGMKCREMDWDVGAEMLQNPIGELANFARVIVQSGDDQIRDLEPDFRFLLEPRERIEHRL